MNVNEETQPLSGVRLIDLTQGIPGPYSTKLLADFGADVIKVERPNSGDYARRMGPFPGDVSHPEKSGLFLFLNTNKRGITLDLKSAEGSDAIKGLVKTADILVESFKPGVMARLGLDYDTLSQINPNLIMTSVSNFGQTGPYRDYRLSELVLYAMGGRMNASGLPDRYPLKLGGNHALYQAGNVAAIIQVVERQDVVPAEFEAAREDLQTEILNQRRQQFYKSFLAHVAARLAISIDEAALNEALGT